MYLIEPLHSDLKEITLSRNHKWSIGSNHTYGHIGVIDIVPTAKDKERTKSTAKNTVYELQTQFPQPIQPVRFDFPTSKLKTKELYEIFQ